MITNDFISDLVALRFSKRPDLLEKLLRIISKSNSDAEVNNMS